MPRLNVLLPLALATLTATAFTASGVAQSSYAAGPDLDASMQSQPAPIERSAPSSNDYQITTLSSGQNLSTQGAAKNAKASAGVWLRVGHNSSVQAISISDARTELNVEHGLVNVSVHNPEHGARILIDLPGGQTAILKDGLYTFNAESDTMRVLHGEADVFPARDSNVKPVKVKELHAVFFGSNGQEAHLKSVEFEPFQGEGDLVGWGERPGGYGEGLAYGGDPGYGPYGDGFAYGGYPYFAYGYPYGYPYWGFGYPFGFGFGYWGGYGGWGGYRGGWGGGGFHGGGGGFGGGGHR